MAASGRAYRYRRAFRHAEAGFAICLYVFALSGGNCGSGSETLWSVPGGLTDWEQYPMFALGLVLWFDSQRGLNQLAKRHGNK
jgi:hypothetical protein